MDPVGFVVVFIITWWLSFFCVLPIGVRGQFEENGEVIEGSEEGAPKEPMLKKKVLWASGGALLLTLIAHFAVVPWLASQ
jgi:predicted secreted protein